jgi:hypothetical protein
MITSETLTQLPVAPASRAAPLVALDIDFERRWTAWVAKGRVREQNAQHSFVIAAAVLLIGAAIAYAFVR